jgi:cytochrome d ubiquinol oxidase subunit II
MSLWPVMVPHRYTLRQAPSSESTKALSLIETLVLLPAILFNTAWIIGLCGKVKADIGCHGDGISSYTWE